MEPSDRKLLAQAIAVAAELTATALSEAGMKAMITHLSKHDISRVLAGLERCQFEVGSGRFCLKEVIERMPGGHLSADEAWALVPKDEDDTAVVTEQMMFALAAAQPLIDEGDNIAARMAFRQAYDRFVAEVCGAPPAWRVTLGWDKQGRLDKVVRGVELGRITAEEALRVLPDEAMQIRAQLQLPGIAGNVLTHKPDALGMSDLMKLARERGALPAPPAKQ